MKQYNKLRKSRAIFGLGLVEMIPSLQLGFLRGFVCLFAWGLTAFSAQIGYIAP